MAYYKVGEEYSTRPDLQASIGEVQERPCRRWSKNIQALVEHQQLYQPKQSSVRFSHVPSWIKYEAEVLEAQNSPVRIHTNHLKFKPTSHSRPPPICLPNRGTSDDRLIFKFGDQRCK